jgi:hypothetical protein
MADGCAGGAGPATISPCTCFCPLRLERGGGSYRLTAENCEGSGCGGTVLELSAGLVFGLSTVSSFSCDLVSTSLAQTLAFD